LSFHKVTSLKSLEISLPEHLENLSLLRQQQLSFWWSPFKIELRNKEAPAPQNATPSSEEKDLSMNAKSTDVFLPFMATYDAAMPPRDSPWTKILTAIRLSYPSPVSGCWMNFSLAYSRTTSASYITSSGFMTPSFR
jgi:hypothetical protein